MGEIPSLNVLYKKFKDRSFALVALHCQNASEAQLRSFLSQKQIQYPVATSGNVAGYAGSGIPATLVFDHDGNLLFEGRLSGAQQIIEDAVKVAPDWLTGPGPFSKMGSMAKQIQARKSLGSALSKLRKIVNPDQGEEKEVGEQKLAEATILLERLNAYAERQFDAAVEAGDRSPVRAVEKFALVAKMFKGDSIGEDAAARKKEIASDPGYKKEKAADGIFKKMTKKLDKPGARKNKRVVKEVKNGCAQIIKAYPETAAAKEAEALIRSLEAEAASK